MANLVDDVSVVLVLAAEETVLCRGCGGEQFTFPGPMGQAGRESAFAGWTEIIQELVFFDRFSAPKRITGRGGHLCRKALRPPPARGKGRAEMAGQP